MLTFKSNQSYITDYNCDITSKQNKTIQIQYFAYIKHGCVKQQ